MVCAWKGITVTPDQMIIRAGLPIGRHSYTFGQIMRAADTVGLALAVKPSATWDVIRAELDRNRPVVTLCRYGEISNNQDDFDGSHFVTVVGYDETGVYIHDPDWWPPRREEGANRRVPLGEFERAIGSALVATGNQPYQSLFLLP